MISYLLCMTYSSLLACSIIFQLMVLMLFIIVLLLLIRHSSPNSFAVQRVLIFKTTFNKWLLFVSSTCLINKCQMQLQQVQILYHQCFSCCYYYSILTLSATSVTKSEWKWKKRNVFRPLPSCWDSPPAACIPLPTMANNSNENEGNI